MKYNSGVTFRLSLLQALENLEKLFINFFIDSYDSTLQSLSQIQNYVCVPLLITLGCIKISYRYGVKLGAKELTCLVVIATVNTAWEMIRRKLVVVKGSY